MGVGQVAVYGALVTEGPHSFPVTWAAREGSEVYADGSIQITCSTWREEWIPGAKGPGVQPVGLCCPIFPPEPVIKSYESFIVYQTFVPTMISSKSPSPLPPARTSGIYFIGSF